MKDFNYKKSLGQNFLIDDNIKKTIVDSASIEKNSLIIEVGPGNGAITKLLVKKDVPIIAFEIDERLQGELSRISSPYLRVVWKDFLKVNLEEYISNYNYKKLHLIANLPYYITTAIIEKVMKETKVDEMIIMVQKEVGDRFKANPCTKDYNSLSVFLQYYFDISEVCYVGRECFVPKPNVDSVVIKFIRKKELLNVKDSDLLFSFVRDCFKQKRKNLRNNLKTYDLNKIDFLLKNINKDLTFRAEQLSIEDFVYLINNM